jgi:hypothetical protein
LTPILPTQRTSTHYTGSGGRLEKIQEPQNPRTQEPTEILDYTNPLVYNLVKAGIHPQRVKELYFDKQRTQTQNQRNPVIPRPTPRKEKTPQTQSFRHYRKHAGLSRQEEEEIFGDW